MAEAVTSVLEKLAAVLFETVQEVQAVRGQIEQVQKELRLIQALLRDIDSECNRNNVVTEWLNQVREIANRIDTVIDTIHDNIEENRAESSDGFVRTITKAVKRKYKAYKLGLHDKLEKIIEELDRLYRRRSDLRIEDLNTIDPEHCDDVDDPEVVGLEDDQAKIIEQLLDSSISRRTVLSIVGTGGLGKTTLVQKVYNSDKLEGQFNCRAWQSISQTYNLNELLREILYKVKPHMRNKNPPVTDRDLPVKLKKYFLSDKRYLIILDDVWDIDLWEEIKKALPDMYNASRVIITTRSLDVAKAADCNTKPYKLRYLNDTEGRDLLFRNAFQQHDVQPEDYHHLLDVAERLTKKCGGLPLALVVLGGILKRMDRNYTAWNMLYETMDWSNEDGEKCMKIIARSYEDLPDHLKPCFLYFACFPEDYKISGEHVTRMWMAEGFIPTDGAGTIEDRAEKFLQELVERCLIQVIKKSWNGYCKYVSMHDLLQDLAIRKAKDENFFTVFSKEEDVNNLAASKPCRAALQFCTPTEGDIYSENTHSLLCFGFGRSSYNNSGFGLLNYSGFRSLRVLTLDSVNMTTFTWRQWPKDLIPLRYLGLRNCVIPHDVFKKVSFYNLETIDLDGSVVDGFEGTLDLCDVVIPTLRHVFGSRDIQLRLKCDKHTNLQTIMNVQIHIESVLELGFCVNLRTLVIEIVDDLDEGRGRAIKEWQNLKGVLSRTKQLVYLCITTRGFLPFGGTKDLPCHEKIQKLFLEGRWERNICVPSVEMFPTNLTKLQLRNSKLQEDPMPILERLQSLRILCLGRLSYEGKKLTCSTGGFRNLEKLKLLWLPDLHYWDIKEGAMHILRHLQISYCENLRVLPELQKVQTLQELTCYGPSRELWEVMQMQGKDVDKIKHIPSVRVRDFYDDQTEIIEQLLDRSISRRTVLSIVGTGGLGKTTLAKKVYNSDKLEGQFDCHAWQSIPQTYNLNELSREILYQVEPHMRNKNPPVADRDLPVELNKYFLISGKRYLIILDDVWDINLWEQLKMALPEMYNASRVIITTRSLDVAKAADCNTEPYKLLYQSINKGLALLFRSAFQQHVQPESYPHLLDVGQRLTKKCGGLPLALIVLGGILTRRERTYTAWNTLYETIDWHDKDGIQCLPVLARSYEDLPRYLKDCFLYFACFPEDYKISAWHVTRMWMAEGFVPKDGAGTIEDRAEKCLEELVQRCLIQVTKKSWNGYCKYCKMHDLLRDLAICKAKDENFFTVFSKGEDVNNLAASKPCRAALQFCNPTEDDIYSENTCSLLCFGFGKGSSNNSGFGLLNYSGFGLLRVLTMESIDMITFTRRQWSKGLIHLRYLGLRDCKIPHDIFKKFSFPNLETIDLIGSKVDNEEGRLDLCDVVIPTLRHVYGSGESFMHLPLKWNKHTNLQTIMDVDIHIESVVELGFCINLHTFGISIVEGLDNGTAIKEWQNLKSVLKNTVQLVYLSIGTLGLLPFGGTKDLPCHEKIQKLVLSGRWERNICVPSVEMFPTNLTKLHLRYSQLQEDPMPILERLQSLRILNLDIGSYVGTELICSTGGFPNLEKLKLKELFNLHHWDIKEGAMPILRHLKIDCIKLHVLPELQKVQTLQELTVFRPTRELRKGMQMQGKDVHKIKHIPSVCIR